MKAIKMRTKQHDVLEVIVEGKTVFRITAKGKVLVNEEERFTDKELADALWKWTGINMRYNESSSSVSSAQ